MQPLARLLALGAFLVLGACHPPPREEAPFVRLSLSAALEQADGADKIVMVDFFATWCGPCKRLDAETWADARVRGWLEQHAVALKVDGDKERSAVEQHRIEAYPTMVFLEPDGTELGRIVGFLPPEAFLAEAGALRARARRPPGDG